MAAILHAVALHRAVRLQVYRGKIFRQAVAEAVVSAKHLFAHLVVVPDNLPAAPARHQHRQRKVAQGLVAVGRKLLFHRLVKFIDALAQRSQLPDRNQRQGQQHKAPSKQPDVLGLHRQREGRRIQQQQHNDGRDKQVQLLFVLGFDGRLCFHVLCLPPEARFPGFRSGIGSMPPGSPSGSSGCAWSYCRRTG